MFAVVPGLGKQVLPAPSSSPWAVSDCSQCLPMNYGAANFQALFFTWILGYLYNSKHRVEPTRQISSLSLNGEEQNLLIGRAWPCPSCSRLCTVQEGVAQSGLVFGGFPVWRLSMFALNMHSHCEIYKPRASLEQWVFQQISSGWISSVLEAWSCRG